MTNGPVEASYSVYEDFLSYKSGVYRQVQGALLGGHAITLVGWGVLKSTKYWIAKNSWGIGWGSLGGYFYIKEGECGIEGDVWACTPEI